MSEIVIEEYAVIWTLSGTSTVVDIFSSEEEAIDYAKDECCESRPKEYSVKELPLKVSIC